MNTVYILLKYLHVLLAIIAVGFNATYAIWIARTARQPEHLDYILHGIKFLDDRFANPSYALLLVTGLSMVVAGSWPLTTFWIDAALILYAGILILGLGFYTPALRRQIAELESHGSGSSEYQRMARRSTRVGIATLILVLLIVFLMVVKPG